MIRSRSRSSRKIPPVNSGWSLHRSHREAVPVAPILLMGTRYVLMAPTLARICARQIRKVSRFHREHFIAKLQRSPPVLRAAVEAEAETLRFLDEVARGLSRCSFKFERRGCSKKARRTPETATGNRAK